MKQRKKRVQKMWRIKNAGVLFLLLFMMAMVHGSGMDLHAKNAANKSNYGFTVTQYGNDDGNQSMFYTIESDKGGLIVIDGGYTYDAETVKTVILQKGGVVDAWIITHPHPDHCGAFNEIQEENKHTKQIKIKNIYAVKLNYKEYKKYAKEWDDFPTYERFLAVTKKDKKLKYVKTGEERKIDGLHIKFLHAYSKDVKKYSKDLCNDGSLMFKVYGKKQSMLFCADVGKNMSSSIIKKYKKLLKSDVIQMGHHGNGGLNNRFYKLVSPKKAFFDAPKWLVKGKSYQTSKKIKRIRSMNSEIYTFETAPNSVYVE